MSSWGCPHDLNGTCTRVKNIPCDPGMRGCVLFGRFVWADESKNRLGKAGRRDKPEPSPDEGDSHRGPSKTD